jgi:tetratricopeptide (TPR) repeat protein
VNPRSWLARNNLGAYYTMVGDAERAYPACVEAVRLNPDAISAHENLALYHFTHADYATAAEHLTRAIGAAEKLPPAARPEMRNTYFNLARTLDLLGRPEEAASVRRTIQSW